MTNVPFHNRRYRKWPAFKVMREVAVLCTTTRAAIPQPSQADIQMTKAIIDIAAPLGISVHDHIIVGKNGHASLKGMRLI